MANHYHKRAPAKTEPSADLLLAAIEAFVAGCRTPAVLEHGEEPQLLEAGLYALSLERGQLRLEVWSDRRSLARRILAIERHSTGVLDCAVERFGGKPGRLSFLDLNRPQTAYKQLCATRENFGEKFRRMLYRQFPAWEVATLTSSMDLRRTFSPIFPRARLVHGHSQIAALACPQPENESAFLTAALIWYDYVRLHAEPGVRTALHLFLPDTAGTLTAHRLRWLRGQTLAENDNARLFRFNAHGSAGEVDPADLGNLATRVARTAPSAPVTGPPSPSGSSERHLEEAVRAGLLCIDPNLLPSPVHSQVLTFAALDRDLIDLLAVSARGSLSILELKVSEDPHLPIQALDYWIRIRWHAQQGELQHLFPGVPLAAHPPALRLVAPALSFHPTNSTVLAYFSPEIEVERVGINSDWQTHLKVVMRLSGAAAPISHGGS